MIKFQYIKSNNNIYFKSMIGSKFASKFGWKYLSRCGWGHRYGSKSGSGVWKKLSECKNKHDVYIFIDKSISRSRFTYQ